MTARAIKHRIRLCLACGLCAALAACGSSGSSSTVTAANAAAQAAKYTRCMRQHGLSNFPDPKAITENGTPTVTIAFPPGSTAAPQFNIASGDCRSLFPASSSQRNLTPAEARRFGQGMLAFARCMRGHGVSNFPDPPSPGSGQRQGPPFAGVDWHAPAIQTAGKTCIPASRGAITPALLQRFETVNR
jgi:hypothetical protein